jgi:uncharacterized protein (TIGR04168 family)
MGGSEFSFPASLGSWCGISTIEQSTRSLEQLVMAAPTDDLVFLAHNGPCGLGVDESSMFGRDFHPDAGDWGDVDLARAVDHAKACGKRVLGVCAGHMHRPLKSGEGRQWQLRKGDTLYVNAARVPRHLHTPSGTRRHHVAVGFVDGQMHAKDVWVELE